MAVQIHFEGTADEVRAEMRRLLGGQIGGQEAEPTPSEKKGAKTPKAEPKTAKVEDQAPTPPSEAKVDASFDEVKARIPKLMDKLGKPGLVEFLATFDGAKKGSEIKESRYAEFIKAADEKLA